MDEEYYLSKVVEGRCRISGDTLRFENFDILFHQSGCATVPGDYLQSEYTLYKIENDQLFLNYNYTLDPVGHSGDFLSGRWGYTHSMASRYEGDRASQSGMRHYYFIFLHDQEFFEFGWEDDFESCFSTNVRYNGLVIRHRFST